MCELMAYCCSEITGDYISFGMEFDEESNINDEPLDWIGEGLSDSFWDNYRDFTEGVKRANLICEDNSQISQKEALFLVFGHFILSFELNGKPYNLEPGLDVDEAMYAMLVNVVD